MKPILLTSAIFVSGLAISCAQPPSATPNVQQNNQTPSSQSTPAKSERGTPDEAKTMLQKAVEHYNSVGRKQALADFNAKKPPFIDRDLYVVCIGNDHIITANGGFPQYVGRSADLLKDADGKPVGKAIWEIANNNGEGSVQYRWLNPVTGKSESKIAFSRKVGDDVCSVGAYNPQ